MIEKITPFSISKVFNAPRDLVFKVHTDINHLQNWMSPKISKSFIPQWILELVALITMD